MFDKKLLLLFGLIIAISVIDVLANAISFIPIAGDILETLSETGMEIVQLILVGIGFAAVGRR